MTPGDFFWFVFLVVQENEQIWGTPKISLRTQRSGLEQIPLFKALVGRTPVDDAIPCFPFVDHLFLMIDLVTEPVAIKISWASVTL